MKIMTILGTRPEIIRLSRIIPLLDQHCEHVLAHTGQNYDRSLNEVFFDELGLRGPDHVLSCRGNSAMEQIGQILAQTDVVLAQERPDRLLVLGDTNSALSAIAAKRRGIPVYHMEAGNRCFDDRVPEEINRRLVDHASDVLMPYTERSRDHLLREGIESKRIYVTGNPIREVLDHCAVQIDASQSLKKVGVEPKKYLLVTLHRAENVDVPERLMLFLTALERVHEEFGWPVVCSVHPRTRSRLESLEHKAISRGVWLLDPMGLFDFIQLERHAGCVLSDSGTVQEECCIFGVPSVTLRDVTERPETVEAGRNVLSGADPETILACTKLAMDCADSGRVPDEYKVANVSGTVLKILASYRR